MKKIGFLAILVLATTMSFLVVCANAADLYVSPFGNDVNDGLTTTNAVRTIQRGITLWTPGQTIRLAGGTYTENVTLTTGTTGLSIFGGYSSATWTRDLIRSESIVEPLTTRSIMRGAIVSGLVLDGITIANGDMAGNSSPIGAGLYLTTSTATINNCVFQNNRGRTAASLGGAMALYGSPGVTVTGCYFFNNTAGAGGVVVNSGFTSETFTDCTFTSNAAVSGGTSYGGVTRSLDQSTTYSFSRCTFSHNTMGVGSINTAAVLSLGGNSTIENCVFNHNTYAGGVPGTNNIGTSILSWTPSAGLGKWIKIVNCTFYANTGRCLMRPAQAAAGTGNTFSLVNCAFDSNVILTANPVQFNIGLATYSFQNNLLDMDSSVTVGGQTVAAFQTANAWATGNLVGTSNLWCTSPDSRRGVWRGIQRSDPAPGFTTLLAGTTGFVLRGDPQEAVLGGGYVVSDYDLSTGSPAINAGTAAPATAGLVIPTTDKSGAARTGLPDIGAYEYPTAHTVLRGALLAPGSANVGPVDYPVVDDFYSTYTASVGMDWAKY